MLGAGGGSWEAYRLSSEQFAALTGIKFEYTFLPDTNAYTKTVLDVTTGTNAFDGYVYTYPWKGELAPYFADPRSGGAARSKERRRSISTIIPVT